MMLDQLVPNVKVRSELFFIYTVIVPVTATSAPAVVIKPNVLIVLDAGIPVSSEPKANADALKYA